jgi:hypothetical protein
MGEHPGVDLWAKAAEHTRRYEARIGKPQTRRSSDARVDAGSARQRAEIQEPEAYDAERNEYGRRALRTMKRILDERAG